MEFTILCVYVHCTRSHTCTCTCMLLKMWSLILFILILGPIKLPPTCPILKTPLQSIGVPTMEIPVCNFI